MADSIRGHLRYTLAHDVDTATEHDWWTATCLAVRDRVLDRSETTRRVHREKNVRRMYYLSLEYLMGRLLEDSLRNSGVFDAAKEALASMGKDLDAIIGEGPDLGLGNGGLGRLAACFLDSLATLDLPSVGYGISYEFGLFRQQFVDGKQIEHPDVWKRFGSPWEIIRPEYAVTVKVYGRVETDFNSLGQGTPRWIETRDLVGVPHDIPIVGHGTTTVNFLRLWESRATEDIDLGTFNEGSYVDAVREKAVGETISKVLYPNDSTENGRELRLVQQYFFVACSLRDIITRHFSAGNDWDNFADKVVIQLNDTHPAVAIPELMRILVDEEGFRWDKAWRLVEKVFAYTNHTLLPEALERWSVDLFKRVLPRHLQIVFEINRIFLEEVVEAKWPGDNQKKSDLSIVEEGDEQRLRMAHLSVVASHSTNGVAALHTQLLKARLFKDFDELYPGRINNKTNGITPRRWLSTCNPALAGLIDDTVGDDWRRDLDKLQQLADHADDKKFQKRFLDIKEDNKRVLAAIIEKECGITVDPTAMFDVQIKRLHEYKRQHLNLLHILALYRRLLNDPEADVVPRVFIFGAKAAPGYTLAKDIIHAINAVGKVINEDERIGGKLKVAFLPNYSVSLAERIIPASDLSEQISTAGKEASGTGNMKLALNGSLTIGTLDGANVEILEEVGDDNIFIFGKTVEEVAELHATGYNPYDLYWADEELREVIDWLASDYFTGDREEFQAIRQSLLDHGDPYLVLADFASYLEAQERASEAFRDRKRWARMAILNTARVGKFSSDRTIRQYADEIWKLESVPVG